MQTEALKLELLLDIQLLVPARQGENIRIVRINSKIKKNSTVAIQTSLSPGYSYNKEFTVLY
jgi:hypothetical protein